MKIRKVKWANHPILGNLELDFVNPVTNKPYSTIVLAGENGTGKTTILETLNTFLSIGSFEPFDGIEFEVRAENGRIEKGERIRISRIHGNKIMAKEI